MNAVGHYLYGHVVHQVDALHRAFVLVSAAFVETGHGVIEVRGVLVASLVGQVDVFKLGLRMPDGGQYAFRRDIFAKLHGARKFGGGIPTLDAMGLFQQGDVFLRVGIFDVFRHLPAGHLHVEVVALQVKSQYGRIGFGHQLLGSGRRSPYHGYGGRGERGENTSRAVLHVRLDGCPESVFASLHEVAPATAMDVDFHAAGDNISPFGVNQRGAYDGQVAIGHFQNFVVTDEHRSILQPSLGRQDTGIDNLCQHIDEVILCFMRQN